MIEYLDNWKFIEFSTWAQNVSDAVYDFYMYKQIDLCIINLLFYSYYTSNTAPFSDNWLDQSPTTP